MYIYRIDGACLVQVAKELKVVFPLESINLYIELGFTVSDCNKSTDCINSNKKTSTDRSNTTGLFYNDYLRKREHLRTKADISTGGVVRSHQKKGIYYFNDSSFSYRSLIIFRHL